MSRKKIIWIIVLLVVAAVGVYGYKEYTRTNKDISKTKPDFTLAASQLIRDFEANDSLSAKKFNGKVLELKGLLRSVERDEAGFYTLVMGDSTSISSVRCSIDSTYHSNASRVIINSSIIVRGVCTGYNRDDLGLGSDVILNRCVIIE